MSLHENCTNCGVKLADWEKSYRVISHLCHNCYKDEQEEIDALRSLVLEMGNIIQNWMFEATINAESPNPVKVRLDSIEILDRKEVKTIMGKPCRKN